MAFVVKKLSIRVPTVAIQSCGKKSHKTIVMMDSEDVEEDRLSLAEVSVVAVAVMEEVSAVEVSEVEISVVAVLVRNFKSSMSDIELKTY